MRRLPETAESIFCPADMSISASSISGSLFSSIVTEEWLFVPDNVWYCSSGDCSESPCLEVASCSSPVRDDSEMKPDIKG